MGVVVKDYRSCMQNFAQLFGIEKWEIRELDNSCFLPGSQTVNGKPAQVHFMSVVGLHPKGLSVELVEPMAGDHSLYADFLEAKGEGIHHFFPSVVSNDEFEKIRAELEALDIPICQSAGISEDIAYYYIETTKQLGVPMEIITLRNSNPKPGRDARIVNYGPEVTKSSRLPVEKLYHYSVVTDGSADTMKANYEKLFGINAWYDYVNKPDVTIKDMHYYGKPASNSFKTWSGRKGPVGVEIVEPLAGQSVFQEMLQARGQGVHHIMSTFTNDSAFNGALEWAASKGMPVAQDGTTPDGSAYVCFLDARACLPGMFLEIICQKDGLPRPSDAVGDILLGDSANG
jgi:hypothetical protein